VIPVVLALEPSTAVQLAILVIGGPLFALVGSAIFPLSSSGADAAGVAHVVATGLMGVIWAGGFTVVPLLAGVVAQGASTTIAYLVTARSRCPCSRSTGASRRDHLSDARARPPPRARPSRRGR
jgi:hypothetical protein